jgi:hypothetical protein
MAQAGCILLLLGVVAAIIAPLVGGFAAGFVITVVLTLALLIAGYFYLKGSSKRKVQGVLARIDAYNPRWQFEGAHQSSHGGIITFSWSASTVVATEDGSLSARLTESVEAISSNTHREANVQVYLGGRPIFGEQLLDITDNEYAIAFINSRIAAVAGDLAADPLTRCRAHRAAEASKRQRESEIRRKYTGT